jgi:hypothetical protein
MCHARPWRQIVGVAFTLLEFLQFFVIGKELPGNLKVFTELDRKVVVHTCDVHKSILGKVFPIEIEDSVDNFITFQTV